MGDIADLLSRIKAEASRESFSIDTAPYLQAARDIFEPILFAGSLDSKVAFFGRDLGKKEVLLGEPLIGDAGQRARRALHRHLLHREPPAGDPRLSEAVQSVLLTNTVPYKPVDNRAYPSDVKERFRPFVAELLTCHWRGASVITLGTEAFQWFKPYAVEEELDAFWKRADRYETTLEVAIFSDRCPSASRRITLAPLPHPSPLNRTYLARFPALLDHRLQQLLPSPR